MQNHSRRKLLLSVFIVVFVGSGVFLTVNFPKYYPEQTLEIERRVGNFFLKITLPIKIANLSIRQADTKLIMPVYGEPVSEIADTWHAPRDGGRVHEGQDIFATRGTPIFSATEGYLVRVGDTEIGGNVVYVIGAGGRRYYYAHLDRVATSLRIGQKVTTDTVLGFVGNTGNASGTPTHLHFGVYEFRRAINPLSLLVDRQN
jgi:murein DD-endopeptidase MepM/ murein hydrolase activator NlpD